MTFLYTPEALDALRRTTSEDRLRPYLDRSDGDLETALRLCELNARLSALFYVPLQFVEVAVRNDMDLQMQAHFGNDWLESNDLPLQPQDTNILIRARAKVTEKRGGDYTRGDLISELNFGFWVGLLNPKNEVEIWRKSLYKSFSFRPKGTERKAVQGALNAIRRLRNRIAHHCRILHRDLAADHATIIQVAGWICPVTQSWVANLSEFDAGNLPIPQPSLPHAGLPTIDPMPPATPLHTEEVDAAN